MPLKTQYFPHEINLKKSGHLTDQDLVGFTRTVRAVRKLLIEGTIDTFIVPNGILLVKDKTTITIKQYEDGKMPGGFADR